MLYILKAVGGSSLHHLISGTEYIVGRKNADIVINNDASISRKHSIISVESDTITVTDCGSKYGTCHNSKKILANTKVRIDNNDKIKFGVYQSIYIVEKVNIVTTGSGLNGEQKVQLKNSLEGLGGTLVNNWNSTCTHLTTQEIILTMKVLLALIDDRPFVKLDYWKKFLNNVKAKLPPPKIEDFKPPLAETLVDSSDLVQNPERKVLFKGKIFVFPTAKIKSKMEELIERTGGTSISWDKQSLSPLQITNKSNYLFVHSDEAKNVPQSLLDMHQHLKKLGQRTIPIQEIAMAVLTCSCEKDCNPNFNRVEKVFMKQETAESHSEVFPLAYDTQTQESQVVPTKEEVIIPESLAEGLETLVPVKPANISSSRQPLSLVNVTPSTSGICITPKRITEEPQENPFKKMKLDNSIAKMNQSQVSSDSKKRKSDTSFQPPAKKSSLRENPFAYLKNSNLSNKKLSAENPFTALATKREVSSSDDNPFMKPTSSTQERSEENRLEDVEPELEMKASISISLEPSHNEARSYSSNGTWLSKTMCKVEEEEVKEDLKELFNLFKNTVFIERCSITSRPTNITDNTDGNLTRNNSGKNFKKFRKVRPLRPQISIINVTLNAPAINGELITVSDDQEEEEERPRVTSKKGHSRRFDF